MTKTAVFTIASWNYAHFARTLAASLAEHEPSAERFFYLADTPRTGLGLANLPEFQHLVRFDELAITDSRAFTFRYDVMELNTAIKPTAFLDLFARGFDRVIYLDPDIRLYGPLGEVSRALDAGASTVLTPHSLAPNLNPEAPNDLTFMQAGIFNLGFMALANRADTASLLAWWQERLQSECVSNRLQDGIFVDQKFIDLWPGYCADTHILRDPGYNVAYWNLDTRVLSGSLPAVTVEGRPLAFFHFSGIVPGDRSTLSKHQKRWSPYSSPILKSLLDEYQELLDASGRARFMNEPYGFGAFSDGTAIPTVARWVFREELEPYAGDPFSSLPAPLNEPVVLPGESAHIVSRIANRIRTSRPDLTAHFDLLSKGSQIAYAEWFSREGAVEYKIPTLFVNSILAKLLKMPVGLSLLQRISRTAYRAVLSSLPLLRKFYWIAPQPLRRRFLHGLFSVAWPAGRTSEQVALPLSNGVTLVGYPFAETGVGEALRSLARSTSAAEVSTEIYNCDAHVASRQLDRSVAHLVTDRLSHRVNVFCVNADMLGSALQILGAGATTERYNIVRPFWELPKIPTEWLPSLAKMDELWAPTKFIQRAFSSVIGIPVVHMPMAISAPSETRANRAKFGLPEDRVLFMFAFDISSYPARKNPIAVLEAFHAAFGNRPQDNVGLVIKTMGVGPGRATVAAAIARFARGDPRIVWIDRTLERGDVTNLLASCDVFVSLHRSEGFGLAIAEAMLLGKAVISTDYSGSTDFVSDATGIPVPFREVPVLPEDYPYFIEGQVWAEPDIAYAARAMRTLAENPDLRRSKGHEARKYMMNAHSDAAVGQLVSSRIDAIEGSRR